MSEFLRVPVMPWATWGNVKVRKAQWLVGMIHDGLHNMVGIIHNLLMSSKSPTLPLLAVPCHHSPPPSPSHSTSLYS